MDNGSKALVVIGMVGAAMYLGMCLTIYGMKQENKRLQERIQKGEVLFSQLEGYTNSRIDELHDRDLAFTREDNKINEKVSILDESIDSKDKRWAKIKKVREAIEGTAGSIPPILELTSIASAIVDNSDAYDVPIPLILGVMKRESNFNRRAISKANARGLMQVMPETAKEIAGDVGKRHYSLFNVKNNVQFGVYYLRKMLDTFEGQNELAIRGYNCGPTYVERVQAGEYHRYPEETVEYLEKVLEFKEEYENLGL
jgi:hypothetical protein